VVYFTKVNLRLSSRGATTRIAEVFVQLEQIACKKTIIEISRKERRRAGYYLISWIAQQAVVPGVANRKRWLHSARQ
jgi:hypothetical protein